MNLYSENQENQKETKNSVKEQGMVVQWLKKKKIHLPMQKTRVQFLDREDPLEKEMATHSSILAWEIP